MGIIQDLGEIIVEWDEKQRQRVSSGEQVMADKEIELLKNLTEQETQPVPQQDMALNDIVQNNPYAKGATKALEETGYEQAKEAITMGVPHEKLLSDLLAMRGTQGEIVQSTVTPQTVSESPQAQALDPLQKKALDVLNRTPKTTLFGVLADLLTMGTATPNLEAKRKKEELGQIETVQKITGQEPLQKGKKEELGLEYVKSIAIKNLELAQKQAEEGRLKPEHIFNKFEAASTPFITARDAHARLEEAAKDPSPAGDLALLYNYMKVLDPGSTIRESEFATAAASGSIPQQMKGAWNKVINGKRLDDSVRQDFLDRSRKIFTGMKAQQDKTTKEFKTLAEKNGIDFNNVVRDTALTSPILEQIQAEKAKRGLK